MNYLSNDSPGFFDEAQLSFPTLALSRPTPCTDPLVDTLLQQNAPVAIGVSGGKDSCAVAFAVNDHLDSIGHLGPRLLIHSDLGRTEWRDSISTCQRLADALHLELVIVRRQAGDMLARWQQRWLNNLRRYSNLECVKLILPWSTPSMRFCTSELKTDIICRYLATRFQGQTILSVTGIRRQESPSRAKAPLVKEQPKLSRSKPITQGFDWHPLIHWSRGDVFAYLREKGFELHEAYRLYQSSRVSCCFCIMSSRDDLRAAARCADNHDVYRQMVELEIDSTFSFQADQWLADVAPALLSQEALQSIALAKHGARRREKAEARIPRHLLYVKGWPTGVPTYLEAQLLCDVRKAVADAISTQVDFIEPNQLIARYQELIATRHSNHR